MTDVNGTITTNYGYTYDPNGNLTTAQQNGAVTARYDYDARDQLRKFTDSNGNASTYDYDFSRKRLARTTANQTLRYVYAGDTIINDYRTVLGEGGADNLLNRYDLGDGEVIRAELTGSGDNFYFSDAQGSTTALSNLGINAPSINSRYEYDAFGNITNSTGGSSNAIGYTGQRHDSETGLMALGNGERYYAPGLGRFIQQDSWTGMANMAQSMNRYAYANGNPLKYNDPTGHAGAAIAAVVAGVAGAVLGGWYSYELQQAEIKDGLRRPDQFSWGEVAFSAAVGAVVGVAAVGATLVTPVALPLLIAGGGITSATQIYNGYQQEYAGYKNVGAVEKKFGAIGLILSLLGARSAYKGGAKPNAAPKVLEEPTVTVESAAKPLVESAPAPKQLTDGGRGSQKALPPAPERAQLTEGTKFIGDEAGGIKDLSMGRGKQNTTGSQEFVGEPNQPPAKTYGVDPEFIAGDKAKGSLTSDGYASNPTAKPLESMITQVGNIGNRGFSGKLMYVVTRTGQLIVGTRAKSPSNPNGLPHPTLIGGKNPTVKAAGMVEVLRGKILGIDNASGHFKPNTESLRLSQESFEKLPPEVFHKDFRGYTPYKEE